MSKGALTDSLTNEVQSTTADIDDKAQPSWQQAYLQFGLCSSQLGKSGVQLALGLGKGCPLGCHTQCNCVVLVHGTYPHANTGAGL